MYGVRRGSCTLGDCMNKFTESELLSGSDSYYCGRCKKHRKSIKEISIQRLPPVLVIHLKRFLQTRRQRTKIATNIDFPDRGLDLRELGCLSEYV
jgi:ubiquitin C-terminal hydrolase